MARTFRYTAYTTEGEAEQGTLEAESQQQAMAVLARRDLTVSELSEAQADTTPRRGSGVATDHLVAFAYELSTLLSAGLSLPKALELKLRDRHDPRMRQVVKDLLAQVRNGVAFSQALQNHPDVFPSLFPALVRSGESTGNVPAALKQLAGYLEKADSVKNRILSALTYPVTVVILAMLIMSGLLVFMVPRFHDIYAQMGVPVPWFTRLILSLSQGFRFVLMGVPLALLISWPVLRSWGRKAQGRAQFDRFRLAVPWLGALFQQLALANFNKNLALLLASGMERREAVELASLACGNEYLARRFQLSRKPLTEGSSLHASLATTGLFSDMMLGMIEAGESGGQLPLMLSKSAEVTEGRLDQQVSRVLSILEPLAMTVIGFLVGGAILALGAPLLSLPSLVSP